MSRRHQRESKMEMEGGSLIPPSAVAIQEGHQELLKASHIKVDSRYFAIDPNLDFESSTILCEDRAYVCDQVPSATQPITFTIQPQFNVFRSLAESRFVFTVQAVIPAPLVISLIPKPYWAQLFVRDFTTNINNVSVSDQHSRTASYAGFIKILLTQGNLKPASLSASKLQLQATTYTTTALVNALSGEDTRALQEGIISLDVSEGEDWMLGYNNVVMAYAVGAGNAFGNSSNITTQNPAVNNVTNAKLELTYRPQDGVWRQPKLLPPGVNLNFIFNLNTIGTWCNGYINVAVASGGNVFSTNPDGVNVTFNVLRAQFFCREFTPTQTCLKAYQSLIMRQPLYYSCMTTNTLLYPLSASQQSVQLTNVFAGRLPNIIVIGLLSQAPSAYPSAGNAGNIYNLGTYSPLPPTMQQLVNTTADCIQSVQLTVNGRTYPHLWSSNMQSHSSQDISQWYEQYRQCCLISALNGRNDGEDSNSNFDTKYVYDNPILSKSEFQSQCTFLCFNIRRSGTIMNDSGDKEVGSADILVNINGTAHPSAQLLIVGVNTDSLMSITDGGSTTSFVF